MAEAGTEVVAVAVPMEEAEEVASTAVVEAADTMEAVAGVMVEVRIAAESLARTAAVHRAVPLEEWVHMDAAARMAAGVRMARTAADRAEIRQTREMAARDRVRGIRIR
jgi:hypothetical protein